MTVHIWCIFVGSLACPFCSRSSRNESRTGIHPSWFRSDRYSWLISMLGYRYHTLPSAIALHESGFRFRDGGGRSPYRRLSFFVCTSFHLHQRASSTGGEIPGVPGCLEHISVLKHLPKEAKTHKRDMTVLWLDLAYVYRTVPYKRMLT